MEGPGTVVLTIAGTLAAVWILARLASPRIRDSIARDVAAQISRDVPILASIPQETLVVSVGYPVANGVLSGVGL